MTCPTCGAENEPGRKFCGECGTRLARTCPGCGFSNAPTVRFCGECGNRLDDVAASATSSATIPSRAPIARPGGTTGALGETAPAADGVTTERRLVSVLFADLVGFTARSDGSDPEQVREFLSRYFDTARDVVAALRRHDREVHRRRRDGRLGHAGCARGRRGTRRARRPRPRRCRAPPWSGGGRRGPRMPRRRPDGRSSGHHRRHEPGHGRGRPGQHRVAPPVGRATRCSPRRRSHGTGCQPRHPVRARRRADPQGQDGAGSGLARPARRRGARRAQPDRGPRGAVRGPRRRAALPEGRVPRDGPRAEVAARLDHGPGGHRQEPPGVGVLEVHGRPARDRPAGTRAAHRPTARGSRSGRWAR